MSWSGGPLPGRERPHALDHPDDDIIEMWKEKRIGKRTLDAYKELGGKIWDASSEKWGKKPLTFTGNLLADTVRDISTLEGNEKYNPSDLITYGFMKTLQGVGVVTDTVIGKPVSFVGHNVLGLDKEVADLTGDVTEAIVTPIAAAKGVKAVQGAVGWVDDAFALASGTGVGTGAHGATGSLLKDTVRKHVIPQTKGVKVTDLKQNILDWYKSEMKTKGLNISQYKKIKRENFGQISAGGEDRMIVQIGKALRENDASLIKLPKVKTVKLAKANRHQATTPPGIHEMYELADDIGMPRNLLNEWRENATISFSSVQEAAKRTSKYTGEIHAGHFTAAQSKPLVASELYRSTKLSSAPTTGRAAGLEHYLKNIIGSNKIAHDINIHAAKRAGIPITWADDLKMWWKIKQNKAVLDYASDFTLAERKIIEAIPYKATKSEVEKIFKKLYSDRKKTNPNLGAYTEWAEDLKRGTN